MKYSFTSRIRYSEIGEDGNLTLPGLINYFQDCSTFQSEAIGEGVAELKKRGCAWVLSAWQIHVRRYPSLGEAVKITTWASGFKGFLGMRNFTMETEDGEMLACANSIWSYVNMETGHPVRAPKETTDAYGIDDPIDEDFGERKVKMPEADSSANRSRCGRTTSIRTTTSTTHSSFPLPVNAFRRTSPCAGCAPNTNSRRTSAMSCIRCAPRRKTAVLSR